MWSAMALFDDPPAVCIDDGGKVNPSLPRSQIGDVTDPNLVQRTGVPLPFHRIDRIRIRVVDDRGGLPSLRRNAHQAQTSHGGGNGFAGDDLSIGAEVGEDPRGPIDLVRVAVEPHHFLLDRLPTQRALRGLPQQPGVVAVNGTPEAGEPSGRC
jgi:hypothetical protein